MFQFQIRIFHSLYGLYKDNDLLHRFETKIRQNQFDISLRNTALCEMYKAITKTTRLKVA